MQMPCTYEVYVYSSTYATTVRCNIHKLLGEHNSLTLIIQYTQRNLLRVCSDMVHDGSSNKLMLLSSSVLVHITNADAVVLKSSQYHCCSPVLTCAC
jgi:adenylate cyclase